MRWEGGRRSSNVEDRRGMRVAGPAGFGGLGVIVIVFIIALVTGQNPLQLLQMVGGLQSSAPSQPTEVPTGAPSGDPQAEFISVVLGDTEDTWSKVFSESGERYQPPVLVLFENSVQSACGMASSAVGPFYCPADQKVYLDLTFFRELDQRFGAPRRLRPGLRRRARDRPSHPDAARRVAAGRSAAAARVGGRGQRAVGTAGAAGRLLRRRVGQSREPAAAAGPQRCGGRAAGRGGHRRRSHAEAGGRATSRRRASRTARRSSASNGSAAG